MAPHRFARVRGPAALMGLPFGLLSGLPSGPCAAAELHVPAEYPTIQAAIEASVDGDAVVVAPGAYAEALRMSGRQITLRSSGGPEVTTLDGAALPGDSILVAIDGETFGTVVEGFTFTNGQGSLRPNCTSAKPVGGAIYVGSFCALAIRDCRFVHNGFDLDVIWGGAIYAHRGSLRVIDCDFVDNGLYVSDPDLGTSRGGAIGLCGSGGQTLEITGCSFLNNYASYGGAVRVQDTASTLVSGCQFAQNNSSQGGGMFIESCGENSVLGCGFSDNTASHGGGLRVQSCGRADVEDCAFTGNSAAFGAGLNIGLTTSEIGEDSTVRVEGCRFEDNTSGFGGGVFAQGWHSAGLPGSPPAFTLTGSRFTGNTASACCDTGIYSSPCWKDGVNYGQTYYGGGADVRVGDGATAGIYDCVFAGNTGVRGGGLSVSTCGEPEYSLYGGVIDIANTTVHQNTGTGLDLRIGRSGQIRLANSIVRGNTSAQEIATLIKSPVANQAHLDVVYSNVEGGFAGTGNTDADPLFVDPSAGDLRLRRGSPAIDAGDSTALPAWVTTDLDGLPRRTDDPLAIDTGVGVPAIDLGAHEFQPPACAADFDASGFVDTEDFDAFVHAFEAGDPSADFDGSGFVDTDDFDGFVHAFEAGC